MPTALVMPLFIAGLAALYLGERALSGAARVVASGLGATAVLVAFGFALWRSSTAHGARRRAYAKMLLGYGLALVALVGYGATSAVPNLVPDGKLRTLIVVGWPAVLLVGLAPALAMEAAARAAIKSPVLEYGRLKLAARSALIVALALVAFAGVNFAAAQWNRKVDLSYFKTARPGSSTVALVSNLTQPVRFVLFFPPGNDVLEHARAYVEELSRQSPQARLEVADHALEPELARTLKVRGNGYLAITNGTNTETVRLGVELDDARSALANLDAKVQQSLLRVARAPRTAYFTTGHFERDYAPAADDKRLGLADLKELFETLGYSVKRLGLSEGLGSQIPKDASLVVIAGPLEPLLPAERTALAQYLEHGGRLLVLVDAAQGADLNDLLAPLGVRVSKHLAANDRYLVRVEGRGESPYDLVTTRASAHPSVTTLSQAGGRLNVVLLGTGVVSKLDSAPQGTSVTLTLRSMPETWEDTNGNGKLDPDREKKSELAFAAAIERSATTPQGTSTQAPVPMRAVVVANADVAGNGLVRHPGNAYFFLDSIRWLGGDEKEAGEISSEKDTPIVHRKEQDAVWFYGTSFIVPALVLAVGLLVSRKPTRKL